jgi:hypothetical protein
MPGRKIAKPPSRTALLAKTGGGGASGARDRGDRVKKLRRRTNPFYVLLILAGVAFGLTACLYGIAMVRHLHGGRMGIDPAARSPLIRWVDQYGTGLMIGELVVLGVATGAAIVTDPYWTGES